MPGRNTKEDLRIHDTLAMIPPDVSNILEVGCKQGRVSHGLSQALNFTGIDIHWHDLNHYHSKKVLGNATRLPMIQNSFDLVLATEILEHLDTENLKMAVHELARATSKYILLTVPYKEALAAQWARCEACGQVFHLWRDQQPFTHKKLQKLIPGLEVVQIRLLGPPEKKVPAVLYTILRKYGNLWANNDSTMLCTKCFISLSRSKGNRFGRIFKKVLMKFEKYSFIQRPYWIGCLYRKKTLI